MPLAVTATSIVTCTHGAKVTHVPVSRVLVQGAPVLVQTDTNAIVGCPFTLPTVPPKPSPCIVVRWTTASLRVFAGGTPVLAQTAVGLGVSPEQAPQGPPIVNPAQARVQVL
jgi:hypothetical protein